VTHGINETGQVAELAYDRHAVRKAKEDLLSEGVLTAPVGQHGVRNVIESSWRRCIGEAVPTNPHSITYCEVGERESTLVKAAKPVLERLNEHLDDTPTALVLSDGEGHIVMRMAPERRVRDALDNASAAEGFDFSERSIGTNGLGTVIAERRPLLVRGSEHYNDALESLTCAGTPVFEPFSKRILGTFSLACKSDDTSPLLSAIATDVGRQIESNLTTLLGAEERALIQSYVLANKTETYPVIVLSERTVFANTLGLAHVNADTHALLWTHLQDSTGGIQSQRARVPLQSGWYDAVVEHVDGIDEERSAYCVRLLSAQGDAPDTPHPKSGPSPRAEADSTAEPVHPRRDIDEQLSTAIRHQECLALDGASGTGKLHVASAVSARFFHDTVPLVLDLSSCQQDEEDPWFIPALDGVAAGRTVVLRHLQDLPPRELNRVKALAERFQDEQGSSAPLVLTVDTGNAPAHIRILLDQLATTVRLPTLAEMPEQVPALVTRILAAMPATERDTRVSSEALQLLMRWPWPGNIAELRRTIEFLARRMSGKTLKASDLPIRMQHTAAQRQLTMMETAERDSIVTALQRSRGNRSQAAYSLGIGRTTLYRKMRFYHLKQ
jgi:transcriptional regulator of acetoin/glycerol metabolism